MSQKIIIHGGAGRRPRGRKRIEEMRAAVREVLEQSYPVLEKSGSLEAVVHAVTLLEDNPIFNAGTGSRLQADGKARMTASLMDGNPQKFSAVINIEDVKNPIRVAHVLQEEKYSVLAGLEACAFARQKGFRPYSTVTGEGKRVWMLKTGSAGTVGAVAIDRKGTIAAATSTGGLGKETPGRVSDVASPCGTYANGHVGVSCTGIGEGIINTSLASCIGARVTDGMGLKGAVAKGLRELEKIGGRAGVIAVDRDGNVVCSYSTEFMSYGVSRNGKIFVKAW